MHYFQISECYNIHEALILLSFEHTVTDKPIKALHVVSLTVL